jgi:hypothetical protein
MAEGCCDKSKQISKALKVLIGSINESRGAGWGPEKPAKSQ